MAMKQFKAESKKLLDLMINSIYTNKEIFLRELISNASDAIDKLYFRSLTDSAVKLTKDDFEIELAADKASRTLTIQDNGIGMTKEELEKNLGTIARSGSLDFKSENQAEGIDIIGQFGVGFYSAFMVAARVTVVSRAFGEEEAWQWESRGAEGYTITPAERAEAGTTVTLVLKEDVAGKDGAEGENYSQYLEEYTLADIVKKYSDYVRYPIRMERTKSRQKPKPADAGDDYTPEYESYTEVETVNSMVPLWRRDKKDVTAEEYNEFYKQKFMDYTDPARVITARTEGTATYNALLFIPGRAPYDYYTREYEKGLQLYASGVLIMDRCADLLPDHFSFVKGIVDSQDLSLNISREMLQKDSQLRLIRTSLEKKIKSELAAMKNNEREKYEEFWGHFGRQLKFGCYEGYGMNSDLLKDLLLFYSAKEKKLVTLEEYVAAMPEEQKFIYYASGDSADRLAKLPAAELVLDKGYDLLLLTEDVDEFCLQILRKYGEKDKEKEFKNVSSGELGLESEEEKKAAEAESEAAKPLFEAMQKALEGKVKAVRLSTRLKSHPVCLSSEGPLSIEMEKVLSAMPNPDGPAPKSEKVLELNGSHPVFEVLKAAQEAGDTEKLNKYSALLYDQALLIEGLPIEDPVAYAQAVCELMK